MGFNLIFLLTGFHLKLKMSNLEDKRVFAEVWQYFPPEWKRLERERENERERAKEREREPGQNFLY